MGNGKVQRFRNLRGFDRIIYRTGKNAKAKGVKRFPMFLVAI